MADPKEHADDPDVELFREPVYDGDDDGLDDVEPSGAPSSSEGRGTVRPPRERLRRIIAVSGAKGGVGKSLVATNLAIYLATIGRKVVIVDADANGANAHTFLGVPRPNALATFVPPLPSFRRTGNVNLDAFGPAANVARARPLPPKPEPVAPPVPELPSGVPIDVNIPGLRLLHAGIDEPLRGERRRRSRSRLKQRLSELDAEYIVVDLGSGTEPSLLDFYLDADLALFVSLPEPTAIENSYAFIRHAFARFVRKQVVDPVARHRLVEWQRKLDCTPAPLDLVRRLEAENDPLANVVRDAMDRFRLRLVFNQTRLRADLELGDRMRSAASRRLGLSLEYLGYIDYDDTVWTCVRTYRPLLVESPGTKASKSIEKIARRLLAIDSGKARPRPIREVPPDTHHDLLEVDRGATDEEIRRAYKRAREVYAPEALCRYGLFDNAGLEALRTRLDEAYDVLLDPARRRPYELSVFPPDSAPAPESARERDSIPRPPAPPITPDTEFRGSLLRAVRESQGLEIREISQRSKIGQGYIRAIEEDDYASLPALVYVRGFVFEIAKLLRLDPEQVSRTYIKHYRRWVEDQERG